MQMNQKLQKSAFTCEINFYSLQNSETFTEHQSILNYVVYALNKISNNP